MKKILFLLLMLFALNPINLLAQIDIGIWQPWRPSDCYKNLHYRVKLADINGTTMHWQVQIKNEYPQIVSFNYFFTDDDDNATDRFFKRKTLQKNEKSKPFDLYFQKKGLFVLINKLSLSPFADLIEPCDNESEQD